MAFGYFADERGTQWIAWEVAPIAPERRSGADRRSIDVDEHERAEFERTFQERRHGEDRRTAESESEPGATPAPRPPGGWLAFETAGERRRLAPIPDAWERLPPAELAKLCQRAAVVAVGREGSAHDDATN